MPTSLHLFFRVSFLMLTLLSVFVNPLKAQESSWYAPEKAIEVAHKSQKPIVIFISIPNCGWCLKMEREVLPKIRPKWQNHFVFTRINAMENHTPQRINGELFTDLKWAQKLNIKSFPSLIFIRPNGKVFFRLSGFVNQEKLQRILSHLSQKNRITRTLPK